MFWLRQAIQHQEDVAHARARDSCRPFLRRWFSRFEHLLKPDLVFSGFAIDSHRELCSRYRRERANVIFPELPDSNSDGLVKALRFDIDAMHNAIGITEAHTAARRAAVVPLSLFFCSPILMW